MTAFKILCTVLCTIIKISLSVVLITLTVICLISAVNWIGQSVRKTRAQNPKNLQKEQITEATKVVHCSRCRKRYTPECMMNFDCECGGQWEWTVVNGYCLEGDE